MTRGEETGELVDLPAPADPDLERWCRWGWVRQRGHGLEHRDRNARSTAPAAVNAA
jgi:hypothetical protein